MLDEDDASTKAKVIVLFVLTWQSLFRIANVSISSLFRFIIIIVVVMLPSHTYSFRIFGTCG